MKKIILSLVPVLLFVLLLVVPAMAVDLNMSVAASLTDVVTELSHNFAMKNADVKFLNNFGASGSLAKQIESGAPADLFFSANVEWINYLKEKRLVEEKNIAILGYNVVVFVGKPGLKVSGMQDLVKLDKIAIGSPKSVPAGEYAMEALKEAGIDKQLEGKLVMARDVRVCLTYADRGEVDGAFVYKTDAEEMAKNVKILFTVPQGLYPQVTYPVGLTVAGSSKADATAFFRYLQSAEARKVLTKHGFIVK